MSPAQLTMGDYQLGGHTGFGGGSYIGGGGGHGGGGVEVVIGLVVLEVAKAQPLVMGLVVVVEEATVQWP